MQPQRWTTLTPTGRTYLLLVVLLSVGFAGAVMDAAGTGPAVPHYDLTVTDIRLRQSTDSHLIAFYVKNHGEHDADDVNVTITTDPPVRWRTPDDATRTIDTVPWNQDRWIAVWLDGWHDGDIDITVTVDPEDTITESDETNNVAQEAVHAGRVDLAIDALTVADDRPVAHEPVPFRLHVHNSGNGTLHQFQFSIYHDGTFVRNQTSNVEIGPGKAAEIPFRSRFDADGRRMLRVELRDPAMFGDLTTEGNTHTQGFDLQAPGSTTGLFPRLSLKEAGSDGTTDTILVSTDMKSDHVPAAVRITLLHNDTVVASRTIDKTGLYEGYAYSTDDTYTSDAETEFAVPHQDDFSRYTATYESDPGRPYASVWKAQQRCTIAADGSQACTSTREPTGSDDPQDDGGSVCADCDATTGVMPRPIKFRLLDGHEVHVEDDPPVVGHSHRVSAVAMNEAEEAIRGAFRFSVYDYGQGAVTHIGERAVTVPAQGEAASAAEWSPGTPGRYRLSAYFFPDNGSYTSASGYRDLDVLETAPTRPTDEDLAIVAARGQTNPDDARGWNVDLTVATDDIGPYLHDVSLDVLEDAGQTVAYEPRVLEMGSGHNARFLLHVWPSEKDGSIPEAIIVQARIDALGIKSAPFTIDASHYGPPSTPTPTPTEAPEPGTDEGQQVAEADAPGSGPPWNAFGGAMPGAPATPLGYAAAALGAAGLLGAFGGAVAWWREPLRYRWFRFLPALPLFSRISKDKALDHKTREAIVAVVKEQPGIHFRGIMKSLGLANGTAAHHLQTLEREGFVKTRKDGAKLRFFPTTGPTNVARSLNARQRTILSEVRRTPGILQASLADRLGVSRQALHQHVAPLRADGILMDAASGRTKALYLDPQADRRLTMCGPCGHMLDRGTTAFGDVVCPDCGGVL